MVDPDFGMMQHNGIDAWDCRVEFAFPHPGARFFAVHLWASQDGPSERQRDVFRQLQSRYRELWPNIAKALLAIHQALESADDLNNLVTEHVGVHIGEQAEDSVELVYTLVLADEGNRAYFVPLRNWKIVDVIMAD